MENSTGPRGGGYPLVLGKRTKSLKGGRDREKGSSGQKGRHRGEGPLRFSGLEGEHLQGKSSFIARGGKKSDETFRKIILDRSKHGCPGRGKVS